MENDLRNIKITLAYDGSKFKGWQKHSDFDNSVEDHLYRAIKSFLKEDILLCASSRTDKGVHALKQVVNFRTKTIFSLDEFKSFLRKKLEYIYVLNVEEVSSFFHSRHHSIGKKYVYQIWNAEEIERFYYPYCWHVKEKLNVEKMTEFSKIFIGKKDFKKFSRESSNNTIRTIFDIRIKNIYPLIVIEIKGDGFLYNMVRCIVANIVSLTLGNITIENIGKRFIIAPAEGLFLEEIFY